MKLYYTTSDGNLQPQTSPSLSLGGYISSSELKNGTLHSLFGPVESGRQVRGVILKNETGANVNNGVIYIQNSSADPLTRYRVALVALVPDAAGCVKMERIPSVDAIPQTASFVFSNSNAQMMSITNPFPDANYIGVWIERFVIDSKLSELNTCETLYTEFKAEEFTVGSVDITVPDNTADILNGKHIHISTKTDNVIVYFDSGTATYPSEYPNDWIVVGVPITNGAASLAVATALFDVLKFDIESLGKATITQNDSTVTWTMIEFGEFSDATSTEPTILITNTQGAGGESESTETPTISIEWT